MRYLLALLLMTIAGLAHADILSGIAHARIIADGEFCRAHHHYESGHVFKVVTCSDDSRGWALFRFTRPKNWDGETLRVRVTYTTISTTVEGKIGNKWVAQCSSEEQPDSSKWPVTNIDGITTVRFPMQSLFYEPTYEWRSGHTPGDIPTSHCKDRTKKYIYIRSTVDYLRTDVFNLEEYHMLFTHVEYEDQAE